jgi:hypothetical protein
MRYWLAVAALGAALMVMPAWAQRGGGGHGGGFGGGHGGFGGHAGFASHPAGGFRGPSFGSRWTGGGPGWGYRHGPHGYCWGGRCYYGRGYYRYPWGYGYWPYAYAGWGWPWYGDDYSTDNGSPQDASNYYPPPADYQSQAEIDRLHDEVAQLRDQVQSARNVPRPPEPKEAAPEPTQLVFADKHTEQIQNYAIVRQNLWIFDGNRTRKIPLASLDLPATEKANQDRGVDFEIPN